jgi:hypothetical protein
VNGDQSEVGGSMSDSRMKTGDADNAADGGPACACPRTCAFPLNSDAVTVSGHTPCPLIMQSVFSTVSAVVVSRVQMQQFELWHHKARETG